MLPNGPKNQIASYLKLTGNARLTWFQELYAEYGDTVSWKIAHQQILLTRDPKVAEEVLNNPTLFRKNALGYRVIDEFGKDGLFTSDYEKWKTKRPILQPFFSKVHQKLYYEDIQQVIDRHLNRIKKTDQVVMAADFMGEITVDIALRIFFGYSASIELIQELLHFSNKLSEISAIRMKHPLIPSSFPLPFNVKFNKRFRKVQEICKLMLDERRKADVENSTDFLGALIQIHENDPKLISEENIIHEMITFILAGALTTAHSTSWIWYELLKNPSEKEQLLVELEKHQGESTDLTWMEGFDFMNRIIQEAVRMHPSIPAIPRGVRADGTRLADFTLKKGTEIIIDLYGLNRHPNTFEQCNEFLPQRYLNKSYRAFEYMPWGGGIRKCIGANFSVIESSAIVLKILQRFRVSSVELEKVRPKFDVTLHAQNLKLRLIPNDN